MRAQYAIDVLDRTAEGRVGTQGGPSHFRELRTIARENEGELCTTDGSAGNKIRRWGVVEKTLEQAGIDDPIAAEGNQPIRVVIAPTGGGAHRPGDPMVRHGGEGTAPAADELAKRGF